MGKRLVFIQYIHVSKGKFRTRLPPPPPRPAFLAIGLSYLLPLVITPHTSVNIVNILLDTVIHLSRYCPVPLLFTYPSILETCNDPSVPPIQIFIPVSFFYFPSLLQNPFCHFPLTKSILCIFPQISDLHPSRPLRIHIFHIFDEFRITLYLIFLPLLIILFPACPNCPKM